MIWTITFYDDAECKQIGYVLHFDDAAAFLSVANSLKKSLSWDAFARVGLDYHSTEYRFSGHICRYSDFRNAVKRALSYYEDFEMEANSNV